MLIQTAYGSTSQWASFWSDLALVLVALCLIYIRATRAAPRKKYIDDLIAEGLIKHKCSAGRGIDCRYHLEIDFIEAVDGVKKRVVLPLGATLDISVPAGIDNGQTIRLRGKGGPGKDGGQAGDALIEIKVKPHPTFARKGLDVCVDVSVSRHDAASGAVIEVPTLTGSAKVRIPEGAVSGQVLRLPGKGIKCIRSGSAGHQPVRILVTQEAAYPPPASPSKNDDIEAEFRNVFFNTASADRERIISHWMKTEAVSRTEAMRLAVEDWRKDNCRYG